MMIKVTKESPLSPFWCPPKERIKALLLGLILEPICHPSHHELKVLPVTKLLLIIWRTRPGTYHIPHHTLKNTFWFLQTNVYHRKHCPGSPTPHSSSASLTMMALPNLHPSGPLPHSLISKSEFYSLLFFQRLLTVLLVVLSPCSQHPFLCLNNNKSPVLRGPPI